jgi:hypothetical protein
MTVTGVTPSTFNVTNATISSVQAMFSVTVNGNGTTATYTVTPSTLGLSAGSTVVVFGFGSAAFNGTFTMATQTTSTFTVANATNSGGTLTGGTVYSTSASYLVTVNSSSVGSVSTATAMGAGSYVVTNINYPTMGSNVVAFNGNQYFSLNASLFPLGASNATYFLVSKGTSGSNRQSIFQHGQNGPGRRGFESGQTANTYYFSPGNTTGSYPTSGTLNMAVNNLISVTFNNQICSGWANGSSFTTNNNQDQQVLIPSGGLNTASTISNIGISFNYLLQTAGTATLPFIGNISEILVFNTGLSNADRQTIEGYLAWKWGLQANLPTSHPYYPSTSSLSSISPTNYSGLALWLDAADSNTISFSSGTNVSGWNDKSGNGRNFTVASGAPTFNSTEKAVSFVATGSVTSDTMISSSSITITQNISSIFVVSRIPTNPQGNFQYILNVGNGTDNSFRTNFTSPPVIHPNQSFIGSNNTFYYSGNPVVNTGTDTPTYSATTRFILDGVYANTTTTTQITLSSIGFIGGGYRSLNGFINEVLIYNSVLTTTQRQQIEGYLAYKWGLQASLPAGHPYNTSLVPFNPVYRPFSRNFVPTDIDNCQMWIDPADSSAVTVTGSNVTTIRDKSGNGNNATNGSSTITYASTLNGLPVLLFPTGGVSNILTTPNIIRDPVNSTYFFVIKYGPTSVSGQTRFFDYSGGLGGGQSEFFAHNGSAGTNSMYLENNNNIPGGGVVSSFYTSSNGSVDAFYGNNTFIVCCVRQNAFYTFTTNGVVGGRVTSIANQKLGSGSGYSIGAGSQNAVVGDAIIYNAALADNERQMVEGYLFWKWGLRTGGAGVTTYTGLSVPTSHPYYKFPPPELTPLVPTSQSFNRGFTPYDLSPTIWLDSSDTGTYTTTNNRIKSWRSKGTQTLSFAPLNSAYTLQTGPGTITVPTGGTGTSFNMSAAVLGVGTMSGLTVTVGGTAITGCTLTGGSRILTTGSSVTIANGASVTLANYTVSIPNITIPSGITIPTGGTGTSFTLSSVTLGTGTLTGLTVRINKVAITGCTLVGGSTALTTDSSVTIGNNAIVDTETYTATIPTGGTGTSFTISAAATGTSGVRVSVVPLMISGVSIPNCAITVGATTLTTPSITVANGADVTVQPGPLVNTATRGSGIRKPYFDFSPGGNFFIGPSVTTVGAFNPTAITITAASVWFDGTTIVISSSPRITMVLNQQITFNGSGTVIPGTPTPIVAGTIYYIRSVFTLASSNTNFPTNNITISSTSGGSAITGLTPYTVLSGVTATTGAYTNSIPTSIPHGIPNGAPVALVVDAASTVNQAPGTFFGNVQSVPSTTSFTMLIPTSNILTIPAGTTIPTGGTGTTFTMSAAPIGTGLLTLAILIAGTSRSCTITAGSTTITISTSITLSNGATVAAGLYAYPSGTQTSGVTGHVEYGTNPLISGNLNADGTTLTLTTAMPHNLSTGCIVQPSLFGTSLPSNWAPYTSAVVNSNTGSFVGYISAVTGTPGTTGLQLTVTSGTPPGVGAVLSGTGVTTGTVVSGIIVSGTSYFVNISQNVAASTSFTSTYSLITFVGSISGTALTYASGTVPSIGMVISGTGVSGGTYIVSGTSPNFVVSVSQTTASTTITGANYSIEFTFPSTNWPILPSGLNNSNLYEVNSYNGTSVTLSQPMWIGQLFIFTTAVGSISAGVYYVASIVSGNTVTFSSSRTLTPALNAGGPASGLNIPVFYMQNTNRIMSAGTSTIASFNNQTGYICGIDNTNRKVTLTGMTLAQPTSGTVNFSLIVNPGIQPAGTGTFGANYLNGPYVVQSVPTTTSITISLIPYNISYQSPYSGYPGAYQTHGGVTYTGNMANYGYTDFTFGGNGTGGYSFGNGVFTQATLIYPTSSFYLDATASPTASFNSTTTTLIYVHHSVYPPLRQGVGFFLGDSVVSTSMTANTGGGSDVTSGGRDFALKHGGASQGTRPYIIHNNNQGGQALNNNVDYVSATTPYRIFAITFNSTGSASGDVPALTKNISEHGWRYDAVSGTFGYNGAYINSASLASGTSLVPTVMRIGGDTLSSGFGICIQGALFGGIAELLVFNTALTREQRQLVEGFLAQKYGCQLTLANGSTTTSTSSFVHPYRLNSLIPSGSIIYSSSVSLWLDAADSSTFSNSGLSTVQWNDKSGNGRNATNNSGGGSVGSKITYVTNSQAGLGGVQIINTASTNGLTTPSTFPLYTAQQFSFFVVGRVIGGRNGGFVSNDFSFGQWCIDIGGSASNNVTSTVGTNGGLFTALTPSPAVNVIGTTFLVSLSVTPTSFTQGFETLYINGQNKTTGTGTISTNQSINLVLTRDSNTTTTTYYEVIGFANALSDIQRRQIEGYLAWKWGLNASLPTTHPYYKIRP